MVLSFEDGEDSVTIFIFLSLLEYVLILQQQVYSFPLLSCHELG